MTTTRHPARTASSALRTAYAGAIFQDVLALLALGTEKFFSAKLLLHHQLNDGGDAVIDGGRGHVALVSRSALPAGLVGFGINALS